MGSTELFFFEDASITERVSRSLLGTAGTEGRPAKLTRFVRLRERAARATRRGRGRGSRLAVPGRFPVVRAERRRDWPCEAVAKTARRSKKTQLYFVIYETTR